MDEGITIVISPLLSLIQDQIHNLQKRNIKALTISGALSETARKAALAELAVKPVPSCKLFYVTPELLIRSVKFQSVLQRLASSNLISRY